MLKVYKPVESTIKQLHKVIGDMVLNHWCSFTRDSNFSKADLSPLLEEFYDNYGWFKKSLDKIYPSIAELTDDQREQLKAAYHNYNEVFKLCSGKLSPMKLNELPGDLVEEITKFFEQLYTKMLNASRFKRDHDGTKEYYDLFYTTNANHTCPFCGYHNMKSDLDKGREAYDHYLPKSKYPFAAVNFENLVPMCYECNSSYKGAEDPLKNGSKAFYPFNPADYDIRLSLIHPEDVEWSNLDPEKCSIEITTTHTEELSTWERVFHASDRYLQRITQFDDLWYQYLEIRCRSNFRRGMSVRETIEDELDLLEEMDPLYDLGFLKKAYFSEVLKDEVCLETLEENLVV